jgi:hypothetical protein
VYAIIKMTRNRLLDPIPTDNDILAGLSTASGVSGTARQID